MDPFVEWKMKDWSRSLRNEKNTKIEEKEDPGTQKNIPEIGRIEGKWLWKIQEF